jgi:hypothetical protein
VTIDCRGALLCMAADNGTTRTQTIEDFLTFGLADDAAIARRTLRVTRKATTAPGAR